jgi:predicted O-methyltransferase YrrM
MAPPLSDNARRFAADVGDGLRFTLGRILTGPPINEKRQRRALRDTAAVAAAVGAGPTRLIAAALSCAGSRNFSSEENSLIERIEERRRLTNSSTKIISYRDYGARNPEVSLTAAEMATGTVVERTVGEVCGIGSKGAVSAALLFALVRQQKPVNCVELGTCVGISGSYIAAALQLNGRGKLVTLEGGEALADVARENFAALALDCRVSIAVGPFHDTLVGALTQAKPINFIFVDAHHDEHATKNYVAAMLPFMADHAIAVFDDINWSDGMKRAWDTIRAAPYCAAHFSLPDLGIAVFDRSSPETTSHHLLCGS